MKRSYEDPGKKIPASGGEPPVEPPIKRSTEAANAPLTQHPVAQQPPHEVAAATAVDIAAEPGPSAASHGMHNSSKDSLIHGPEQPSGSEEEKNTEETASLNERPSTPNNRHRISHLITAISVANPADFSSSDFKINESNPDLVPIDQEFPFNPMSDDFSGVFITPDSTPVLMKIHLAKDPCSIFTHENSNELSGTNTEAIPTFGNETDTSKVSSTQSIQGSAYISIHISGHVMVDSTLDGIVSSQEPCSQNVIPSCLSSTSPRNVLSLEVEGDIIDAPDVLQSILDSSTENTLETGQNPESTAFGGQISTEEEKEESICENEEQISGHIMHWTSEDAAMPGGGLCITTGSLPIDQAILGISDLYLVSTTNSISAIGQEEAENLEDTCAHCGNVNLVDPSTPNQGNQNRQDPEDQQNCDNQINFPMGADVKCDVNDSTQVTKNEKRCSDDTSTTVNEGMEESFEPKETESTETENIPQILSVVLLEEEIDGTELRENTESQRETDQIPQVDGPLHYVPPSDEDHQNPVPEADANVALHVQCPEQGIIFPSDGESHEVVPLEHQDEQHVDIPTPSLHYDFPGSCVEVETEHNDNETARNEGEDVIHDDPDYPINNEEDLMFHPFAIKRRLENLPLSLAKEDSMPGRSFIIRNSRQRLLYNSEGEPIMASCPETQQAVSDEQVFAGNSATVYEHSTSARGADETNQENPIQEPQSSETTCENIRTIFCELEEDTGISRASTSGLGSSTGVSRAPRSRNNSNSHSTSQIPMDRFGADTSRTNLMPQDNPARSQPRSSTGTNTNPSSGSVDRNPLNGAASQGNSFALNFVPFFSDVMTPHIPPYLVLENYSPRITESLLYAPVSENQMLASNAYNAAPLRNVSDEQLFQMQDGSIQPGVSYSNPHNMRRPSEYQQLRSRTNIQVPPSVLTGIHNSNQQNMSASQAPFYAADTPIRVQTQVGSQHQHPNRSGQNHAYNYTRTSTLPMHSRPQVGVVYYHQPNRNAASQHQSSTFGTPIHTTTQIALPRQRRQNRRTQYETCNYRPPLNIPVQAPVDLSDFDFQEIPNDQDGIRIFHVPASAEGQMRRNIQAQRQQHYRSTMQSTGRRSDVRPHPVITTTYVHPSRARVARSCPLQDANASFAQSHPPNLRNHSTLMEQRAATRCGGTCCTRTSSTSHVPQTVHSQQAPRCNVSGGLDINTIRRLVEDRIRFGPNTAEYHEGNQSRTQSVMRQTPPGYVTLQSTDQSTTSRINQTSELPSVRRVRHVHDSRCVRSRTSSRHRQESGPHRSQSLTSSTRPEPARNAYSEQGSFHVPTSRKRASTLIQLDSPESFSVREIPMGNDSSRNRSSNRKHRRLSESYFHSHRPTSSSRSRSSHIQRVPNVPLEETTRTIVRTGSDSVPQTSNTITSQCQHGSSNSSCCNAGREPPRNVSKRRFRFRVTSTPRARNSSKSSSRRHVGPKEESRVEEPSINANSRDIHEDAVVPPASEQRQHRGVSQAQESVGNIPHRPTDDQQPGTVGSRRPSYRMTSSSAAPSCSRASPHTLTLFHDWLVWWQTLREAREFANSNGGLTQSDQRPPLPPFSSLMSAGQPPHVCQSGILCWCGKGADSFVDYWNNVAQAYEHWRSSAGDRNMVWPPSQLMDQLNNEGWQWMRSTSAREDNQPSSGFFLRHGRPCGGYVCKFCGGTSQNVNFQEIVLQLGGSRAERMQVNINSGRNVSSNSNGEERSTRRAPVQTPENNQDSGQNNTDADRQMSGQDKDENDNDPEYQDMDDTYADNQDIRDISDKVHDDRNMIINDGDADYQDDRDTVNQDMDDQDKDDQDTVNQDMDDRVNDDNNSDDHDMDDGEADNQHQVGRVTNRVMDDQDDRDIDGKAQNINNYPDGQDMDDRDASDQDQYVRETDNPVMDDKDQDDREVIDVDSDTDNPDQENEVEDDEKESVQDDQDNNHQDYQYQEDQIEDGEHQNQGQIGNFSYRQRGRG